MKETLKKEDINSNLTEILNSFKTKKLSLETINRETEIVRQKFYERKTTNS